MRDSTTQLVTVPTSCVMRATLNDTYDEVVDSLPEMNTSSEDECRDMGILIEHDDDYDDVWEFSEHLLKLQTELDVLTSRARLVQSDRHCRRPKPSQRRIIEDYEEKWREQLGKLGQNGGTFDRYISAIRGTSDFIDQQDTNVIPENRKYHDYSEIPENSKYHCYSEIPENGKYHDYSEIPEISKYHSYSEIPENSEHHEYSEIPENSDHHDYSEIPQKSKPEDVYCLETLVFKSQDQVKKPIWDPTKLKLHYRGSMKKSSKLKRKTLCPSDEDMGKSGHLLRTVQ